MRSRKVFRIYAALSLGEREAFGLYLASPYFNTNQRLIDFRRLLEEALVQQPQQQLSTEEVWRLLPDVTTEYRANGFDKLCAELLAALNDFLAHQAFRGHAATAASHQLKAYVDRHLDEWVPGLFEGLVEKLGKDLEQDAEGLYAHWMMMDNYGTFLFRSNRTPPGQHLLEVDLKLNAFYFERKLGLASAIDSFNRAFKADLQLSHSALLKEVFDKESFEFPLLVRLQAAAWLMVHSKRHAYYYQLKEMLIWFADQIPENEIQILYRLALNYCVTQMNLEENDFREETDEMHIRLLENGGLLNDSKLSPWHFKNIIHVRLRLGAIEWVESFIEEWKDRLSDDHAKYAVVYNRAVLAFYQGEFRGCLKAMETVLRDAKGDLQYAIDARIYSLMAVFELDKQEDWSIDFDTRLNAFRVYLTREANLGEERKKRLQSLVKLFRSLIGIKNSEPEAKKLKAQKFLKSLAPLKPVPNRKWFERQVAIMLGDS